MSLSLATFRIRFPEFGNVPDASISPVLTAALLELDETTWGGLVDEGQAYLTAHKLAVSPYGTGTRLVNKDGTSTYQTHYDSLVRLVSVGAMLL